MLCVNQINNFYLTSFLKNQTYFAPVFILLLQFYHLSFQEIFWVFTIGAVISFIIEIPSGIIADLYGKRKSLLFAKLLVFISFIVFAFANEFWGFVIAQIIFEFGNAFRSGTETSFVYDYLKQNKNQPSYAQVKGKQKFYARIGESIATLIGGIIASTLGFSYVFLFAAIPALANFILCMFWKKIKEPKHEKEIKKIIIFTKASINLIIKNSNILRVLLNISLFSAGVVALDKFIQPYMVGVGMPIFWIGLVYSITLAIAALAIKYAVKLENVFGSSKTINYISFATIIPIILLVIMPLNFIGIILLVLVILFYNMRAPIIASVFQDMISSKSRATVTSILELSKSLGKIIVLPIVGYFADAYSMFVAFIIIGIILTLTVIILPLSKKVYG